MPTRRSKAARKARASASRVSSHGADVTASLDQAALAPHEVQALLAPLRWGAGRRFTQVVLAVSGGPDSMALLHLAASWSQLTAEPAPRFIVATVDHRLRPESAAEAAAVARLSAVYSFAHHVLHWDAPRPATGSQAAARAARYRLLAAHARQTGSDAIVTAHTRDDQAETLLMRLARGSGVDGLAAMSSTTEIEGVTVLRPLLGVAKSRLVATLAAAGIACCDDPSNQNMDFERVRLRAAWPALAAIGLTSASVATSAARAGRARQALDVLAARLLDDPSVVVTDARGFAAVEIDRLGQEPAELQIRVLGALAVAVGGTAGPIPLARLEQVVGNDMDRLRRGVTLGRVQVLRQQAGWCGLVREARRHALPRLTLQPGQCAIWDGRFQIALAADAGLAVDVRAGADPELDATVEPQLQIGSKGLFRLYRAAAPTRPAAYQHGTNAAVPYRVHCAGGAIDAEMSRSPITIAWLGLAGNGSRYAVTR